MARTAQVSSDWFSMTVNVLLLNVSVCHLCVKELYTRSGCSCGTCGVQLLVIGCFVMLSSL